MADLSPTERPDTDRLRRVGAGTDGDGIPLLTPDERAFLRAVAAWIEGVALAARPAADPVPLSVDEGLKVREPTSWSLTELIRGVAQSAPTTQPADDRHANLRRILADYDEARLLPAPPRTTTRDVIAAVRELIGDDT